MLLEALLEGPAKGSPPRSSSRFKPDEDLGGGGCRDVGLVTAAGLTAGGLTGDGFIPPPVWGLCTAWTGAGVLPKDLEL